MWDCEKSAGREQYMKCEMLFWTSVSSEQTYNFSQDFWWLVQKFIFEGYTKTDPSEINW